MKSIQIPLFVAVPERFRQQLVMQFTYVLLHADRVVQARQIETMIVIRKIVESEIEIKESSSSEIKIAVSLHIVQTD